MPTGLCWNPAGARGSEHVGKQSLVKDAGRGEEAADGAVGKQDRAINSEVKVKMLKHLIPCI